jgi:hypothetical protein
MSGHWYCATIIAGIDAGHFRTGERVVFRMTPVGVEILCHGGATAVVSVAEAKRRLETIRVGRDFRPLRANGQAALSIRWIQCREARKFGRAA